MPKPNLGRVRKTIYARPNIWRALELAATHGGKLDSDIAERILADALTWRVVSWWGEDDPAAREEGFELDGEAAARLLVAKTVEHRGEPGFVCCSTIRPGDPIEYRPGLSDEEVGDN